MTSQPQFKSIKMCRYGTREGCPIGRCRFQHSAPVQVLYSSALKGVTPPPPTPAPSPSRAHFPSTEQGTGGWGGDGKVHAQHIRPPVENVAPASGPRDLNGSATTPSGTFDANTLTQDGLALYRAWLESQVEVQKARIQAMSKQYSIPIPQLGVDDAFDFPPLGMMHPTMASSTTTVTSNSAKDFFRDRKPASDVPTSMPPAPRLEPTQPIPRALPKSASAASQYRPISATPATYEMFNSSTTNPRKVDMSYQTTPCRHFTLNRGWCPWGDECCFIHDPELEWVPAMERGSSGRSTPSSTTLVGGGGNNYKPIHNGTVKGVAEPGTAVAAPRSSSSQSAHCWGFIQGLCPHSDDNCKYIHPADVVPYMKYTPCLTWPRCGYPTEECPLKHPQVDKLPMSQPRRQPAVAHQGTTTEPVVAPQPQTAIVREQLRPPVFPTAAAKDSAPLIIPHDAAYASAVRFHNPMPPSTETFSPPPPRVTVRLSRPSDDTGHSDFSVLGMPQNRGRRVSFAVQRPDAEFAGGVSGPPGYGKEYVRGHGRGKSMHV